MCYFNVLSPENTIKKIILLTQNRDNNPNFRTYFLKQILTSKMIKKLER